MLIALDNQVARQSVENAKRPSLDIEDRVTSTLASGLVADATTELRCVPPMLHQSLAL